MNKDELLPFKRLDRKYPSNIIYSTHLIRSFSILSAVRKDVLMAISCFRTPPTSILVRLTFPPSPRNNNMQPIRKRNLHSHFQQNWMKTNPSEKGRKAKKSFRMSASFCFRKYRSFYLFHARANVCAMKLHTERQIHQLQPQNRDAFGGAGSVCCSKAGFILFYLPPL